LPSAILGAGPFRSGCPFSNLGDPGVGNDGHCAKIANEKARNITTAAIARRFLLGMFIIDAEYGFRLLQFYWLKVHR
jgi:hypothetical protein